jgi:fatty-acid desaturase
MWYLATSAVNIINHKKLIGDAKFSESVATNSSLMNLLTGIGNHNNHHKFPQSHTYSTGKEIDINAWIIEKFFYET